MQVGAVKKKVQAPAPVAGPSKSKPIAIPEPKVVKPEPKEKPSAASEKPKPTGKLNFFKKPEKAKDVPEVKKIKQEEPAPEPTKKMFFSKPPAKASVVESKKPPSVKAPSSKAASPAPSVASTKSENEPPSVCHYRSEMSWTLINFIYNRGASNVNRLLDWVLEKHLQRILLLCPRVRHKGAEWCFPQMKKTKRLSNLLADQS